MRNQASPACPLVSSHVPEWSPSPAGQMGRAARCSGQVSTTLWEPLLRLASGRAVDVDVEHSALVRRYGLIDDNGEVWSPEFGAYLRSR